ncbi:hypothetical protein [Micromonospora sp. DH14]|uniref:hypothetical protein n=1 Tax=Micromonospora sp. DH14 TaxID=3040120 RepID=UPI002442793F|nr:hypothetical protein [Micromonospora sp. DH14]MDG9673043.1 hypothetical protein [Micromonospora sp. DH14]
MSIIASASVPPANRLIDADTTDLTAIRRPATTGDLFPVNRPYRPAPLAERITALQAAYVRPLTVDELAARLGVDQAAIEAATAPNDAERACPAWCALDHSDDITEIDGLVLGTLHTRTVAELTGDCPSLGVSIAADVTVEMGTERGEVTDPARVVLQVADDADRTGNRVLGWTGTVEQVEQLAYALLAAARTARTGR